LGHRQVTQRLPLKTEAPIARLLRDANDFTDCLRCRYCMPDSTTIGHKQLTMDQATNKHSLSHLQHGHAAVDMQRGACDVSSLCAGKI
jgi:hypothetical protein